VTGAAHSAPARGCDAVADALRHEGVETLFGLMGDANMALWSVLRAAGRVTIHPAWHEAAAVAMADGWFRATGRVGVATVTNGPGLTNAATSLIAAARNRSALVVITGLVPDGVANPLQHQDQQAFVAGCEAAHVRADNPATLADDIARAFARAQARPGPVVLALSNPLWEAPLPEPWSYAPEPVAPPAAPDATQIGALAARLTAARAPILLAGRGALASGALADIQALAARTGALPGTTLQARGAFADDPWSLGVLGGYASAAAEALCHQADLVIGFGAELGYYTTWGDTLFPRAALVQVDPHARPRAPLRAPEMVLRADAGAVARALCAVLGPGPAPAGLRTPTSRALLGAAHPRPPPAADGIDPHALARTLGAASPDDVRITVGAGHFQGFLAQDMALGPGQRAEFVSQFGAIGQTLPVALGIALADPARPHLLVEGDGSLMLQVQELATAARLGLPLVVLVWNDAGYGAEFHRLPLKGFAAAPAQWPPLDFAAMARAFGGQGLTLADPGQLPAALAKGFGTRGLFLIDAPVSRRSMSDNYRIRYRGEPNRAAHQP
jgi:acetolactate synthase I/II/III large subunit